jgi:mRNA-degrading endonuclease RelE of RelBE toxin-antitoxin system
MSYNIKTTEVFEKQAKRLIKKYASLKSELLDLFNNLKSGMEMGTPIGSSCYKIRLAISSKGKGKSGGARVIINVVLTEGDIYLLTI